ncbi:MAG: hypothetical protein WBV22_05705 [Anaerolineaceae bacterium]
MSGLDLIVFLLSGCSAPLHVQETIPPANLTPSPIINSFPTPELTGIIRPTPTPLPTELSGIVDEYHCYLDSSESPSKTWVLFNDCQNPPPGPVGASLLYNKKTGQFWVYPYCAYMHACDEDFGGFLAYITPIAWSADDDSLYAEFYWVWDSCAWFPNFSQLLIFNLTTGISSIYHERAALYKISPDLSKLAIIELTYPNIPVIIIRNLLDESQFSFTLASQFLEAGDLTWSLDGIYIAFIAVDEDGICKMPNSFSVMLIEVSTRHLHTIIEDNVNPLHIVTWRDGYILELMDDANQAIIQYSVPSRQMVITPPL